MELDEILTSNSNEHETSNPRNFAIEAPDLKKSITAHFYRPTHDISTDDKIHLVIVTHGAGGTCLSAACANLCEGLVAASAPSTPLAVVAFDGSMNLKARTKQFLAVLEWACASSKIVKIALAGRSMGCRAAAIAYVEASEEAKEKLSGQLILESYPLIGNGEEARKQVLLDLPKSTVVLFIIGSADEMCILDNLNRLRASALQATSSLLVIKDLTHGMSVVSSVKVNSSKKDVTEKLGRRAGELAAEWVLSEKRSNPLQGDLSWGDDEIAWSDWKEDKQEVKAIEAEIPSRKENKTENTEPGLPAKRRKTRK